MTHLGFKTKNFKQSNLKNSPSWVNYSKKDAPTEFEKKNNSETANLKLN